MPLIPRLRWLKPFVMYAWHLRRSSLNLQMVKGYRVVGKMAGTCWWWYSLLAGSPGIYVSWQIICRPTIGWLTLVDSKPQKCWIGFLQHEMIWNGTGLKTPDELVAFLAPLTILPPDWCSLWWWQDYQERKFTDWLKQWPGQAVTLAVGN